MVESTAGELPNATYIDGRITLWVPGGKVTDLSAANLERKIRDAAVEIMTFFVAGYPRDLKRNLVDLHLDKVREVCARHASARPAVGDRRACGRRCFPPWPSCRTIPHGGWSPCS
jgi:hypothetical protein